MAKTDTDDHEGTVRLAAFDLDGTLVRGETVCEAIARRIGRLKRMREFEGQRWSGTEGTRQARGEMATWYAPYTFEELVTHLTSLRLAPRVEEGLSLLRHHNFKLAIVSITWGFAVEWFAERLGFDYFVGTGLRPDGEITHFFPEDKPKWLGRLADSLDIDMGDVVAVGDSRGDIAMLRAVGQPYWVGESVPEKLVGRVSHHPDGDIQVITEHIVKTVQGQ